MAIDRRRGAPERGVELPKDYETMVTEALHENFASELKAFAKLVKKPYFRVSGAIFTDEILVSLALHHEGVLGATTVHVSADFDPRASQPTAEELLTQALDVGAGIFGALFQEGNPEALERLAEGSLASLEEVPFDWTELEHQKRKLFVRVDKSNPDLERMTEQWLDQNDPERKQKSSEEQKQTEDLFVVGKGSRSSGQRGSGSGTLH